MGRTRPKGRRGLPLPNGEARAGTGTATGTDAVDERAFLIMMKLRLSLAAQLNTDKKSMPHPERFLARGFSPLPAALILVTNDKPPAVIGH